MVFTAGAVPPLDHGGASDRIGGRRVELNLLAERHDAAVGDAVAGVFVGDGRRHLGLGLFGRARRDRRGLGLADVEGDSAREGGEQTAADQATADGGGNPPVVAARGRIVDSHD